MHLLHNKFSRALCCLFTGRAKSPASSSSGSTRKNSLASQNSSFRRRKSSAAQPQLIPYRHTHHDSDKTATAVPSIKTFDAEVGSEDGSHPLLDSDTYADHPKVANDVHQPHPDEDPGDAPIDWTPEQLQEIRASNYRLFEGEDETDYTAGPARIVLASDGVQDCHALLLTLELSQAVQKAVHAEQAYKKARHTASEKIAALNRFKHTINTEIRNHKSRIAKLQHSNDEASLSEKAQLEEETHNLELMLEEYQLEKTAAENEITWQGDKLRAIQSQLNAMLAESWNHAQVLAPESEQPEEPAPSYDLQAEYQAICARQQGYDDLPMAEDPAVLSTSQDRLKVHVGPEEQARIDESAHLHEALWDAEERLQAAQTAFDTRDDARFETGIERRGAIHRGETPADATSEAFDLSWIMHERELTRELIEAEHEYHALAEAMRENYGEVEADDDGEGSLCESSSSGIEIIPAVPSSRIARWLDDIPMPDEMVLPDVVDREDLDNSDDWEVAELDVGDSVSHFCDLEIEDARNPKKARIREWQEVQREVAKAFEWMRG